MKDAAALRKVKSNQYDAPKIDPVHAEQGELIW
jgi:hypothetical protein